MTDDLSQGREIFDALGVLELREVLGGDREAEGEDDYKLFPGLHDEELQQAFVSLNDRYREWNSDNCIVTYFAARTKLRTALLARNIDPDYILENYRESVSFTDCIRCGGSGERIECYDDLCHSQGRCMHGNNTCNLCSGHGRISEELSKLWRVSESFEVVELPHVDKQFRRHDGVQDQLLRNVLTDDELHGRGRATTAHETPIQNDD